MYLFEFLITFIYCIIMLNLGYTWKDFQYWLGVIIIVLISLNVFADDINSHNNIIIKQPNICCKSLKPKIKIIVKKEIIEKPIVKTLVIEKQVVKKVYDKNRLSLLVGIGPTNLNRTSGSQVDLVTGIVGGIQYQRNLSEKVSVGIQGQSNQTILGIIGFDF